MSASAGRLERLERFDERFVLASSSASSSACSPPRALRARAPGPPSLVRFDVRFDERFVLGSSSASSSRTWAAEPRALRRALRARLLERFELASSCASTRRALRRALRARLLERFDERFELAHLARCALCASTSASSLRAWLAAFLSLQKSNFVSAIKNEDEPVFGRSADHFARPSQFLCESLRGLTVVFNIAWRAVIVRDHDADPACA